MSNRMLVALSSSEGRALVAGSVLGLPTGSGSGCGDHLSVAAAVFAGRLARSVTAAQGGGLPSVWASARSLPSSMCGCSAAAGAHAPRRRQAAGRILDADPQLRPQDWQAAVPGAPRCRHMT